MKMVPSNVRKYKKTTECDKSIVTCDVGTAQYKDSTIKCEEKNGTIEFDKSTITCDISITQYEDDTIKWKKKKK